MLNSVFKVLSYLILVVAIFVLIKYLLEDEQLQLYEHILVLVCLTLLISLIGGFLYSSVFSISGRLNGVLGNPNFLGLFCVFTYPLVDHFKIEESIFTKRGILVLIVLTILCLFLTGSRNGYVSFAIYIAATIFLFRGVSGKSVALCLGLGAFIAFIQIETLTQFIPFLNDLVRPETLGTASARSIVWPTAIDEIERQPWLGGGFEYYAYYMATFAANHGLKNVFWYGVWNTYLAFLLDTGFIGLAAYFFFIYGVIRKSARFIFLVPFILSVLFTGMFEAWLCLR
jgi:O-antigen ligase